jgi:hypothetical protein
VGSPVPAPLMVASRLMLHTVVAWNAVFATAQLALAAGLPGRPTVKVALAATIVWSVAVWWQAKASARSCLRRPAWHLARRKDISKINN